MKKIALVTGSSRGIGLAAAKELENGGCQVVYHASRVSDKLLAAAVSSPFYGVDLSDAEAVGAFADELIDPTTGDSTASLADQMKSALAGLNVHIDNDFFDEALQKSAFGGI